MNSRVSILTCFGRCRRLRRSFAVTSGYVRYSWSIFFGSSPRFVHSVPPSWTLRLATLRRVKNVRDCVCLEKVDGDCRNEWQAGCRKSCRNSWLRTGESMFVARVEAVGELWGELLRREEDAMVDGLRQEARALSLPLPL